VPDFTSEVQPIFNTRCTSCHYGSSPSAGLDLNVDAWDDIVGVESVSTDFMDIVSADSASSSVLWWKIWGEHDLMGIPGGAMPPIGALSDADILLITHWINAGAPE
jgi:cytochrome c5